MTLLSIRQNGSGCGSVFCVLILWPSKNFNLMKFFPQSWPHQDLLSRNVLGLAMRMIQP